MVEFTMVKTGFGAVRFSWLLRLLVYAKLTSYAMQLDKKTSGCDIKNEFIHKDSFSTIKFHQTS